MNQFIYKSLGWLFSFLAIFYLALTNHWVFVGWLVFVGILSYSISKIAENLGRMENPTESQKNLVKWKVIQWSLLRFGVLLMVFYAFHNPLVTLLFIAANFRLTTLGLGLGKEEYILKAFALAFPKDMKEAIEKAEVQMGKEKLQEYLEKNNFNLTDLK